MVKFGGIELDPIELGINGNAILGIKESGKSYLGTELGEMFFESGIPFIAFDPIGIWHNMRTPGKGRGYPVVVAGGRYPDIPLTVASAPEIVQAAMREQISLVIDLFSVELSKADWHRIVRSCAELLLHRNSDFGLRHVFIEEAAEFVPQKIYDGHTYAAVEKLIRMGGNSRLGCTLISPRSQEINKAVLELCENLFLFRQRGKNALENIRKWMDIAGASGVEVMKTLPSMPTGECWAWLGGSDLPLHLKVPQKNSFHPDRRAMGAAAKPKSKPVDVSKFVKALSETLPAIQEEAKANDPALLRAEIARLKKVVDAKDPAGAKLAQGQEQEIQRLTGQVEQLRADLAKAGPAIAAMKMMGPAVSEAGRGYQGVVKALEFLDGSIDQILKVVESVDLDAVPRPAAPKAVPRPAAPNTGRAPADDPDAPDAIWQRAQGAMTVIPGVMTTTPAQQKILDKIAWAAVFFNSPNVERVVLGFLVGKHKKTKSFVNDLGALRSAGLIDYMVGEQVILTDAGKHIAHNPGTPTRDQLLDGVRVALSPREWDILALVLEDPSPVERQSIADHFETHIKTKSFVNALGRLRTLGLIYYSGQSVGAADYLRRNA